MDYRPLWLPAPCDLDLGCALPDSAGVFSAWAGHRPRLSTSTNMASISKVLFAGGFISGVVLGLLSAWIGVLAYTLMHLLFGAGI